VSLHSIVHARVLLAIVALADGRLAAFADVGYVVRLFNELRRRCAFFLAYREYSAADAKQRFEASERKVMGLHASLYTVLNFDATAPSGDANDIVAAVMLVCTLDCWRTSTSLQ